MSNIPDNHMPVLGDKPPEIPRSIPMSWLDREFAYRVHGQTLERLKERGGLSVVEIVGNMVRQNVFQAGKSIRAKGAIDYIIKKLNEQVPNT